MSAARPAPAPATPAARALEERYARQMLYQRVWRVGHWLWRRRVPLLPQAVRVLCRIVFGADVPAAVAVARGVVFMHNGLGLVIHTKVRFEGRALVFHHVTLGNSKGLRDGEPVIGDRVLIGAGACVLGDVRVGDGCIIGANAVVLSDVPDGHMALGNPAVLKPASPALLAHLFPEPVAETA